MYILPLLLFVKCDTCINMLNNLKIRFLTRQYIFLSEKIVKFAYLTQIVYIFKVIVIELVNSNGQCHRHHHRRHRRTSTSSSLSLLEIWV